MGRELTGKRGLRRRMRDVRRELASVRNDIKALEQGKPPSRRASEPEPARPPPPAPVNLPVGGLRGMGDEAGARVASLLEAEKHQPKPPPDEGRLAQEDRVVKERARKVRDERFSDYLASSFEAAGPLRHERRIQRNKAIVLTLIVLAVLVWLVTRFFR